MFVLRLILLGLIRGILLRPSRAAIQSATKPKVAPFDLVFEYNHAVEGWQAFSRPTISRLGEMVHIIGDFMREMSQLVQKEYARYTRRVERFL